MKKIMHSLLELLALIIMIGIMWIGIAIMVLFSPILLLSFLWDIWKWLKTITVRRYWNLKTGNVEILPVFRIYYEKMTETSYLTFEFLWLTRWSSIEFGKMKGGSHEQQY
jgi:hypothetical protein